MVQTLVRGAGSESQKLALELQLQREAHRQSSKALVILEVKDAVIDSLEERLNEALEEAAALKCRAHTAEDRVQAAERERRQAAEAAGAASTEEAKALLAEAWEAERRSEALAKEARDLRMQRSAAQAKAEAARDALEERRAASEAASSRATASDEAEIARLREMLAHCQEDLAQAELEANAAALHASAIMARSEVTPSSAKSRRTPATSVSESRSLPSSMPTCRSRGGHGSARLRDQDLEKILEAVLKQHTSNMATIKSELAVEVLQDKSDAATAERTIVAELRARRDEYEERLRVLETTRRGDRERRRRADENTLRDLGLLEEAADEFRTSLAALEASELNNAASARSQQQPVTQLQLQEAVEDRAEVREELAVARCLVNAEASNSRRLLAELCGRRETLRAKESVQQARLAFFNAAADDARRAATKAHLLMPPPRQPAATRAAVKPQADLVAMERQTSHIREEVTLLQKQIAQKDDTRDAWLEEMLEIRSSHEKAEDWEDAGHSLRARLPTALAESLQQLLDDSLREPAGRKRPRPTSVNEVRKVNDNLAKVLVSLLQLLAQTHRQAVSGEVSAERYRRAALERRLQGRPLPRPFCIPSSQLEQALEREEKAEEEARSLKTPERARLEAAAGELLSELEETRGQSEHLEAQRLAAAATLRAREQAAADEARLTALEPSWRDEAVEEAWRRAREAGRAPAADGDAEEVLRAAQVLRLLGLQLVAWELAESLKSAYLRADSLELANAALAKVVAQQATGWRGPVSPPKALEAAWASKRMELAEAEQRQREAMRLQSEVQTLRAELESARRSEAVAAAELAAGAAGSKSSSPARDQLPGPEAQDPQLLTSMLDMVRQVMEMCSGMLPTREPAGSEEMAVILKEVKELCGFCKQLQQQVQSQRQSLSSAAALDECSQLEGGDRDRTSKRMEALLELQHELQLQYKAAAETVLGLRKDVAQSARSEEALQSELRSKEEAILTTEEAAASIAPLPLPDEVEVTPAAAQLKELCRQERRGIQEAVAEVERARRSLEEQRSLTAAAAARAAEEAARVVAGRRQVELAQEAGGQAAAALAEARQRQRHRDEARAEELAAKDWASHADEEQQMKESLKRSEAKLKEEVQEAERLRNEHLRVEGAHWELQKRLSPSLKRIDELRQRRSTLEAETRRVGAYPERAVKSTQERLVRVQSQVSEAFGQLQRASAEEQQHRAEALVYSSEAAAAGRLGAEAAEREAAAELRLEAVQAKEQWQEIAHRDEHHAWRHQVQELQEQQRRSRNARAAAEASQLEVEAALRRDAKRNEVAELSKALQDAESNSEDVVQRHAGTAPRQREQALLTELAAIRGQEATLLQEMEVLRHAADADASPEPEPIATLSKLASAVPARELQQLHAQLRRAREQKEVLKQEVAVGEREEQLLRKELEEVEQQLRLSREDAERKRTYIATLQLHCSGEAPPANLEAQAERQTELRSSLARARQTLASKDTQLKALRAEAAEAKRRREARLESEAAEARRCAADLARTKALRSELRRKERALQELWAQSEVMESRLEESQSAG